MLRPRQGLARLSRMDIIEVMAKAGGRELLRRLHTEAKWEDATSATQDLCRDMMRAALRALEERGYRLAVNTTGEPVAGLHVVEQPDEVLLDEELNPRLQPPGNFR